MRVQGPSRIADDRWLRQRSPLPSRHQSDPKSSPPDPRSEQDPSSRFGPQSAPQPSTPPQHPVRNLPTASRPVPRDSDPRLNPRPSRARCVPMDRHPSHACLEFDAISHRLHQFDLTQTLHQRRSNLQGNPASAAKEPNVHLPKPPLNHQSPSNETLTTALPSRPSHPTQNKFLDAAQVIPLLLSLGHGSSRLR